MEKDNVLNMTFLQLHEAYSEQQLSPVDVVEEYFEVIEDKNTVFNGYLTLAKERAMESAKESEQRYKMGKSLSILDGIPLAVKDLIETKGIRTTFGSEIYENYIPEQNAGIIDTLESAGMILLGKSNTHQFAMGVTTDCEFTGATRNPYHTGHGCGGSSGGSGCVMAAGMAPAALGTDTGGSIRIPASYCGIVGCKPTYGSVSAYNIMPLSYSLDHVGPMTSKVYDNALLLNEMVGYDARYDKSILREKEDFTRKIGQELRGVKIGIMWNYIHDDPVMNGVLEGFQKGVEILKELGAEMVDVPTPEHMKEYRLAHKNILAAEAHEIHRRDLSEHRGEIDPSVLERLLAAEMSADDFIHLKRLQAKFCMISKEIYERIDYMVSPTTSVTATRVRNPVIEVNGEEMPIWELATHFTWMGDLNGYPAVSIPISMSDGLPVGFQIMGRPLDESGIYQVAYALEEKAGFVLKHRKR